LQKHIYNITLDKVLLFLIAFTSFDKKLFPLTSSTLMSIILIFLFARSIMKKEKIRVNKEEKSTAFFFWGIFVLLIMQFIYAPHTDMLTEFSKYFIIGIITIITLKFLLRSRENTIFFLRMIVLVISLISLATIVSQVLYSILGIETILIHPYRSLQFPRSVGLYDNPNYYSISLLIGIGIILGFFQQRIISSNQTLYKIMFLIISLDLILTFSRGAIIAYFLMTVYYVLVKFNISVSSKKVFYSIAILLAIILIVPLFNDFVGWNESKIISQLQFRFFDKDFESESRYLLWSRGWDLYTSSITYFLFGVGGKNFQTYAAYGLDLSVHNSYLRYLYELGLFGAGLLLYLLITLWRKSVSGFTAFKNPLFFAFLALLLFGLSNDVLYIYEFWVIVACILYWDSPSRLAKKP
jgi:O-antigen ligase